MVDCETDNIDDEMVDYETDIIHLPSHTMIGGGFERQSARIMNNDKMIDEMVDCEMVDCEMIR